MVRVSFGKRVVLAGTLVLMVNLIAPTRVLSTYTFMPIGEAQAQQGGGPMNFVLPLLMMFLMMGAMKNNDLEGEQGKRVLDASKNVPGGGGQAGPNGGQALPNGATLFPNGTVVLPDGGMYLLNGGKVLPDGTMVMPDARTVPNALKLKTNSESNTILNLLKTGS
jgi:hypothetical protein